MKDKELQKKAEYILLNLLNKVFEFVNKNECPYWTINLER